MNEKYAPIAIEILELRRDLYTKPLFKEIAEYLRGENMVLYILDGSDGGIVYPKELSEDLSVTTARVAALLRGMEKKGWITRERDSEDNRKVRIELTPEGHKIFDEKNKQAVNSIIKVLERLGLENSEELLNIYKKMLDSL